MMGCRRYRNRWKITGGISPHAIERLAGYVGSREKARRILKKCRKIARKTWTGRVKIPKNLVTGSLRRKRLFLEITHGEIKNVKELR